MGLFDIFKKKKTKSAKEPSSPDKLWELWAEGKVGSPYAELMTYQSEINNGGHDQYFLNIGNTGDTEKAMTALEQILPEKLNANLKKAYEAYIALEENEDDDEAEDAMDECDDTYYKYEEEINRILEEYASRIEE